MKSKILLVDDEELIRHSISELLWLEGYEVVAVENGEYALKRLQSEAFDLVLLDLMLPGVDGLDVIRYIKKATRDTKVIVLTGHGSLESAIEVFRLGAHDYILKPALSHTILMSVENALALLAEEQRKRLLIEQMESTITRLKVIEGMDKNVFVDELTISLDEGITLDLSRRIIWRGKQRASLTPTQAKLFKALIENRGRVLSHRELVFMVYGYETTDWEAPVVLRPLVSRLRRKLAVFSGGKEWIKNVRGTGYLFDYGEGLKTEANSTIPSGSSHSHSH